MDPMNRLADLLARAGKRADLGSLLRGLVLPILNQDPAAGDPTNAWLFDDGRLRWRGSDGVVRELNSSPSPWITPTLLNGWVVYNTVFQQPGYMKSNGVVYLKGLVKLGAVGSVIFQLPVGYRPSHQVILAVIADNAIGRLDIDANGNVIHQVGGTGFFQLDCSFPVAGVSAGAVTSAQAKVADPMPHVHRTEWAPVWGRTICPAHGVETGAVLAYGDNNSVHGERQIMLGFDHAAIATALAGAEITDVELSVLNQDAVGTSVDLHWGGHNVSAAPAAYSSVRVSAFVDTWPRNGYGDTWRGGRGDITWFGRALRDDQIKGLVVDQPSAAPSLHGMLDWATTRLRITYNHAHA